MHTGRKEIDNMVGGGAERKIWIHTFSIHLQEQIFEWCWYLIFTASYLPNINNNQAFFKTWSFKKISSFRDKQLKSFYIYLPIQNSESKVPNPSSYSLQFLRKLTEPSNRLCIIYMKNKIAIFQPTISNNWNKVNIKRKLAIYCYQNDTKQNVCTYVVLVKYQLFYIYFTSTEYDSLNFLQKLINFAAIFLARMN